MHSYGATKGISSRTDTWGTYSLQRRVSNGRLVNKARFQHVYHVEWRWQDRSRYEVEHVGTPNRRLSDELKVLVYPDISCWPEL